LGLDGILDGAGLRTQHRIRLAATAKLGEMVLQHDLHDAGPIRRRTAL